MFFRVPNYSLGLYLLFFFFCHSSLIAQSTWSAEDFSNFSFQERYQYIHDYEFWKITDNKALADLHQNMLNIAEEQNDIRSILAIHFYMVSSFGQPNYQLPNYSSLGSIYKNSIALAKQHKFEVEHLIFSYNYNDILHGKQLDSYYFNQYPQVIHTAERMEELGLDKFKDYYIDLFLYRFAKFMWDLEDYEKAFSFLQLAEHYISPDLKGAFAYTLINNHLQSYWQKKGDLNKALEHAKKIYELHYNNTFTHTEYFKWWSKFWKEFINIEIASILIEQDQYVESEFYADNGYRLSTITKDLDDSSVYIAEFDALQVLIPIKLKLSKTEEAKQLLERSKWLKKRLQDLSQFDYFKNIAFFKNAASILKNEHLFKDALSYQEQAQLIKDSLDARNHSKKIIVAQQRLDAEKHKRTLDDLKTQKQEEVLIRNISIIILLLVVIITVLYGRNMRLKRKQKEFALQAATDRLSNLTKSYKEKSNLIDSLKEENKELLKKESHEQYMEQLINATILTDEDWTNFKTLFEKVHPNFIQNIEAKYTKPTKAEIRLLVLEKLELSVSQIANMLGVNNNTIYQTRRRLRKKQI
jgi:hypothetical protein